MYTNQTIPFETVQMRKDYVLLRRHIPGKSSHQTLGVDPIFKSASGDIIAHAEAEELPSGLMVSTAGTRKDRATVVNVGPDCRKLCDGMSVLLPPPNDAQKRFAKIDADQDGTNWLVFREDDLITTFEVLPVPKELVGSFMH